MKIKTLQKERRHRRVRSKISGTVDRPRLVVFRSNCFIYAQLIDDNAGKTLAATSDMKAVGKKSDKLTKVTRATEVGKQLAVTAKGLGISKVVFDRGGYRFIGRVKAVAEGAREAGL